MHRLFGKQAGIAPHQVLIEEAQHLRQNAEARFDGVAKWRYIGTGAVVPWAEQEMLAFVRKREEARDRAVGKARPVHPARDRVDRNIRADAVGVVIGAERRRAEARIVRQPVVRETKFRDEIRHVKIAEMLLHRRPDQRAVIAIDRLRAGEARILEVGDLGQNIAPVMIETDHQLIVICRQPIEQNAARVEVIDVGVPHREQRRDRLDGRMACAGKKQRGGTEIRDSGRTDHAIGPRLRDDPVRDFAIVLPLGRGPEAVAGPKAGAGAAHIDDDERIAARHEEIAILRGIR
jgi:hypothetical protein